MPSYQLRFSQELVDTLYEKILRKMLIEKRYLVPGYTARQLAEELHTNTRYISATMSRRFGTNFSQLLAGFRVREAAAVLTNRKTADITMEELATRCGFNSRQALYIAFQSVMGTTPRLYQNDFNDKRRQAGTAKPKHTTTTPNT